MEDVVPYRVTLAQEPKLGAHSQGGDQLDLVEPDDLKEGDKDYQLLYDLCQRTKRIAKTSPRLHFRLLLPTTTPNVAFVHRLLLHAQTTPKVVHVLEYVPALQERLDMRL